MDITLCVITKDEEKNIRKCIEGVKSIVNEIVVVDTGSKDQTVNLAKSMGSRVYNYDWDNNFSNAKNYALEKATGDWIIFLDADEYFLLEDSIKIPVLLNQIEKHDRSIDAIFLKHISVNSKNTVIETNTMIRIFRKSGIRYRGAIHENLYKRQGYLNVYNGVENELVVYHSGYSEDTIIHKAQRNLELILEDMKNGNSSELTDLYLSDCYMALGNLENVIYYSEKFIESNYTVNGYNSKPYRNVILAMNTLEYEYSIRSRWVGDAINKFPKHPDFLWYKGLQLLEKKKYSDALNVFLDVIELQRNYNDIETEKTTGVLFEIYYFIGLLYDMKNDILSAFEYYIKSLQENKYEKRTFQALINITGDYSYEDILQLINHLYDESIDDISFLVDRLAELRKGEVLLYYYNIWKNRYDKNDNITFYTLYSNGRYNESFKIIYESSFKNLVSEEIQKYIVVSALLSLNEHNISLARGITNKSYKKIIDNYVGIKNVLDEDDISYFIELFSEIIPLCSDPQINEFIGFKKYFNINIELILGNVLVENNKFHLAIQELSTYLKYCENNNLLTDKYINYKLGICYFRLGLYQRAKEEFEISYNTGYSENDIDEYFNWIIELSMTDVEGIQDDE